MESITAAAATFLTPAYAKAFGLALLGNGLIYSGIAFLNGDLLPRLAPFDWVYDTTPDRGLLRLFAMLFTLSLASNWIFAAVYEVVDKDGRALAAILGTLLVVLAFKAWALGYLDVRSAWMWSATVAAFAAVSWAGYLLSGKAGT